MKLEVTLTNIILTVLILILGIMSLTFYNNQDDLRDEASELREKLKEEQETSLIFEETEEFIKQASVGKHYEFLVGKAKKEYEKALEELGKDVHLDDHGERVFDSVDVKNIFVKKNGNDKATSYAIYLVKYNNNPDTDNITTQRLISFTLIADWVQTEDGYKVESYKIDLLQDSLDQQLSEMEEPEGEKNE